MVRAITAAANSKFWRTSQSFTAWGRILYEPKYQKKIWTSRGVLRKNSRYPWANQRTGRTWDIRIIAMTRPTRNDRAIDATESLIVTYSPETIQSKYFPEVTIAQSNRYFSPILSAVITNLPRLIGLSVFGPNHLSKIFFASPLFSISRRVAFTNFTK